MTETAFRSGFIALIGRTNVGKSTFLNRILQQKIAIVSDKPQTTRNKILGIYHSPQAQIIFLDTPGFHKPKHRLNEFMVKTALKTLDGVDAICYLAEPENIIGPGDRYIIEHLRQVATPVLLLLNKIDRLAKDRLLPILDLYAQAYDFAAMIPMSALTGENVAHTLETILAYLPEGPRYYPDDMVTDQPERFIVAELIREQVLQLTRDEIPFAVAVAVEQMKTRADKPIMDIDATVFVERASQKGIIIGKSGSLLKQVGSSARQEIETLLGVQVFLNLWVKVRAHWRMNDLALRDFGYGESGYFGRGQ